MTKHLPSDPEPRPDPEDSFGDEALDKLLEEGVLKGYARMELALAVAGGFVVAVCGFFTFFPAQSLPFLFEDYERIVNNEALHSVTTISEGWNASYVRPVTALSYSVDWWLGGGSPAVFHFTSALIHVVNAVLVFALCRRLFDRARVSEIVCLAPALVFLAHPMLAASAWYVAHRGAALGATFTMLTVLVYLGKRGSKGSGVGAALSLCFFTMAWGAHAGAWALPLVLPAVDRAAHGHIRWARLAPMAFLSAAFLVVHASTRTALEDAVPGLAGVWEYAGAFGAFIAGWLDFGTPLPAAPPLGTSTTGSILWAGFLIAGIGVSAALPVVGVAIVWTVAFFGARGLLFAPAEPSDWYVASVGTVLVLPALMVRINEGGARALAGGVVGVLLIFLCVATHARGWQWRDEEQLLLQTLADCPECAGLHDRLADGYVERARHRFATARELPGTPEAALHVEAARELYASAVVHLEAELLRDPDAAETWLLLGEARGALGDRQGVLEAYERARLTDPWLGEASLRLAEAIVSIGGTGTSRESLARAVDLYAAAQRVDALQERDFAQFAQLLTRLGNFEAAGEVLRAGIDKTGSANLRALEERNNQSVEALRSREARIATLSGREKTYEEAYLLHLRRQYLKSSYLLQADLNENGFHDSMWKLLAMNKEQMNQLEGFIDEYRNREEISAQSWRSLGQQFENAGKLEAANAVFSVIPSQP